MSEKSEKAKELFKQGYNCSQSVLAVFCEELGMDIDTAMKISSSFGGGMGRMREVCGTVSGMFMVAGLCRGYDDPHANTEKADHYARIQKTFYDAFGQFNFKQVMRHARLVSNAHQLLNKMLII